MKNKEKYKDKILDIALQHNVVAVDKNDNSIEPCCDEIPLQCNRCLFYDDEDKPYSCDEKFIKWLEEEDGNNCQWLYKLDDEEDGFLKIVESGYIARDEVDGDLMFYCENPTWRDYLNGGYWFSAFNNIRLKNDSFEFIKAGECWAYNIGTKAVNKDIIYNITETLRKDIS